MYRSVAVPLATVAAPAPRAPLGVAPPVALWGVAPDPAVPLTPPLPGVPGSGASPGAVANARRALASTNCCSCSLDEAEICSRQPDTVTGVPLSELCGLLPPAVCAAETTTQRQMPIIPVPS